MWLTENESRQLNCPFKKEDYQVQYSDKCIASMCMAWYFRTVENKEGGCRLIEK